MVFITTITKPVVKEQLRIMVPIHRYHHNTYFGLTVKRWKSAAGKRETVAGAEACSHKKTNAWILAE